MSKQISNNTVIDPNATYIQKAFEKVSKKNNMNQSFGWSKTIKSFEIFTMYSDKTPTISSSNTLVVK